MTNREIVEATLNAWNKCPSIVKDEIDRQTHLIKELRKELKKYKQKALVNELEY